MTHALAVASMFMCGAWGAGVGGGGTQAALCHAVVGIHIKCYDLSGCVLMT